MDLKQLIQQLDVYADGFLKAPHFRARVHMAEHVYDVMDDIGEQIQREFGRLEKKADRSDVEVAMPSPQLPSIVASQDHNHHETKVIIKPLRFRAMTMAQATREILQNHGQLHGKRIEELLKEGGYKSDAEHFQSSLAVALKRDGGFENVGENVWRLKPSSVDELQDWASKVVVNGVIPNG